MNAVEIQSQIENLKKGQVMISYIRPTSTEKLSVEVVEVMETTSANTLLSTMNSSDERFSKSKPRIGYFVATDEDLKTKLGIDLSKIKPSERITKDGVREDVYCVGMLNPTIEGNPIRLQIVEKTFDQLTAKSNAWDIQNFRRSAKNDTRGNYMLYNNQLILSKAVPTNAVEFSHVRITHNATTTKPEDYVAPSFSLDIKAPVKEEAFV